MHLGNGQFAKGRDSSEALIVDVGLGLGIALAGYTQVDLIEIQDESQRDLRIRIIERNAVGSVWIELP